MSEDSVICLALIALIWIGWPLRSIAHDLRELRRMATKSNGDQP